MPRHHRLEDGRNFGEAVATHHGGGNLRRELWIVRSARDVFARGAPRVVEAQEPNVEQREVLPDLKRVGRQAQDLPTLRLDVRLDGGDPSNTVEALSLEHHDRLSTPQPKALVPAHQHALRAVRITPRCQRHPGERCRSPEHRLLVRNADERGGMRHRVRQVELAVGEQVQAVERRAEYGQRASSIGALYPTRLLGRGLQGREHRRDPRDHGEPDAGCRQRAEQDGEKAVGHAIDELRPHRPAGQAAERHVHDGCTKCAEQSAQTRQHVTAAPSMRRRRARAARAPGRCPDHVSGLWTGS